MTATLIDGRAMARDLSNDLRDRARRLVERGRPPGLATVLVGDDYAAGAYERRLRALAGEIGCPYRHEALGRDVEQADALATVGKLNADPRVTGILILRPLPAAISEKALYRMLDPAKDIESVHPWNAGLVALGVPRFTPSTPASAFHLLDRYLESTGRDPATFYPSARVVFVGRSNNVGKPGLSLGLERNVASMISVDHHADEAGMLAEVTSGADVVIVAAGVAGLITADHVKPGAIVVDIGINPITDPETGRTRLVGDVDAASVIDKVEALSPVPGGVGPITDVWLLSNTITAAELAEPARRDGPVPRAEAPNRG